MLRQGKDQVCPQGQTVSLGVPRATLAMEDVESDITAPYSDYNSEEELMVEEAVQQPAPTPPPPPNPHLMEGDADPPDKVIREQINMAVFSDIPPPSDSDEDIATHTWAKCDFKNRLA